MDGLAQNRDVRFQDVHAGQVLVAGVWTVIFRIDEAKARRLAQQIQTTQGVRGNDK